MSERLTGTQQMEQNAEAAIAASQAAAHAEFNAQHVEAIAMDKQIDAGANRAEQLDHAETRMNSTEARDKNDAAEIAIYGSKGRTEGYVEHTKVDPTTGKPVNGPQIARPILGKIEELRDEAGVEDRRNNRRYGTTPPERNQAAAAHKVESDAKAAQYESEVDVLRSEGFELSQVKLLMDMREVRRDREQRVFAKLHDRYANMRDLRTGAPTMTPAEAQARAARETTFDNLRKGDNELMTKQLIRDKGILDAGDYNKFRYKHGRPNEGDRKEFTAYKSAFVDGIKDNMDVRGRRDILQNRQAKELLREQVRDAEREGRGEDPTLPMPIVDPTPTGFRARIRNMMGRGADLLRLAPQYAAIRLQEYYGDDEKGRRRKITTGIVGGLAVAGTTLLALDLSGDLSHHSHAVAEHLPKHKHHHHETPKRSHHRPAQEITIHRGQNPWTDSRHELKLHGYSHPTAAQIEDYDKHMAHLNSHEYSYSGDSSEKIKVGTKLKLPRWNYRK